MDYKDMTPEELRGLAASMEAEAVYKGHIGGEVPPKRPHGIPAQFARTVEVRGVPYTVDMRRFKSREFIKKLTRIQEEGEGAGVSEQLDIFDYVLEPCAGDIESAVAGEMGYVDFELYYDIASEIFEAVNAKN